MTDEDVKLAKTINDVELPTLEDLGIAPSDEEKKNITEKKEAKEEGKSEKSDLSTEKAGFSTEKSDLSTEKEHSDVELEALKQGWVPKDQYKGDPNKWKDAYTYIEHGQLMGKITSYHKELKELRRGLDNMTNLVQKQSAKLDQKEELDLAAQKRLAIEAGDVQAVDAIDKKMDQMKFEAMQNANNRPANDPYVIRFVEENSDWFNNLTPENTQMRDFAIRAEEHLAQQFPFLTPDQRLGKTKEMVVKMYPSHFQIEKTMQKSQPQNYKPNYPTVEKPSQQKVSRKKEITFEELPREAQRVALNLYKASGKKISLEKYAKELVRIGAVEL